MPVLAAPAARQTLLGARVAHYHCTDAGESDQHYVRCRYNPIKTTKTSFLGTMNMLGLAKRTNAKFLLASTSEVYGDPLQHPQQETYWGNVNPIGERSCYDEGAHRRRAAHGARRPLLGCLELRGKDTQPVVMSMHARTHASCGCIEDGRRWQTCDAI